VRALISLSEELPINVNGKIITVDNSDPVFKPFSRFTFEHHIELEKKSYPFLEGKIVAFAGVPPSLLGRTKIKMAAGSAYTLNSDYLFVNNFETWITHTMAKSVFAPFSRDIVSDKMPGWVMTQLVVENFFNYVREVENKKELRVEVAPYFKYRNVLGLPSLFYPFIQSEIIPLLLDRREICLSQDDHNGLLKFTIIMKNSIMFLVSFDKKKWRQSCYYSNGYWQFMSGRYLDKDYYEGLSPDLTMKEFMDLDIPKEIKDWTTFSSIWVSFKVQDNEVVNKKKKGRNKSGKKVEKAMRDSSHPVYQISQLRGLGFEINREKGYYAFSEKLPKLVLFQKVDVNLLEWEKVKYNVKMFSIPERMKSCLNCNKGFYPNVLRCSSCDLIL